MFPPFFVPRGGKEHALLHFQRFPSKTKKYYSFRMQMPQIQQSDLYGSVSALVFLGRPTFQPEKTVFVGRRSFHSLFQFHSTVLAKVKSRSTRFSNANIISILFFFNNQIFSLLENGLGFLWTCFQFFVIYLDFYCHFLLFIFRNLC